MLVCSAFRNSYLDANVEMIEVLDGAIAKRDSDAIDNNYRSPPDLTVSPRAAASAMENRA